MNRLTSQQRKLAYLACIVVLLVPVIILGRPSAPASRGAKADAGGVLATLRTEHDLGEQSFGNVDPSSATMNLLLDIMTSYGSLSALPVCAIVAEQ